MNIDFTHSKQRLAQAEQANDPREAAAILSEVLYIVVVALERMQKERNQ